MRNLRLISLLAVFLASACSIFWASYLYFKTQELERAAARLTFYRTTVETALEQFSHLPFLLSLDPMVIETLSGGDARQLDKRLARFAQSAGVEAIYLMDQDGLTISASNATTPGSFVGQNYGYRPYFRDAMNGELGEFFGIGATTGIPGYFYAMGVRLTRETRGVIAIKLGLETLQESWRASGERLLLSNGDGVVLLASDPNWRYKVLEVLTPDERARLEAARQFADEPLDALDWVPNLDAQSAEIDSERYLYLRTTNLPNSWALHFFVSNDVAVTRAWLASGGFVLLVGSMFVVFQFRRNRTIRAALTKSEAEEALLRDANERLAIEIEDRRAAEKQLQKTQSDLERAGRLAALGQLASSVTHELGQPIAAMRNQIAASEISQGDSVLGEKMKALVGRMEEITRQLKFFSRKGRDQFEALDLNDIVAGALELLEPNIQALDAEVLFQPRPDPVALQGNRLRLEQVITNLVRNALDAAEAETQPKVVVRLGQTDLGVWFEVADNGHGLGGRTMQDLREPFTTTRESGKGMGLGLTISAGIVTDHGGTLSARDRDQGGAVFRADFPREGGGAQDG